MKNMKKLASLILALVMVFSLATTAFAATVTNSTTHSYDAYQIFTGTQAEGKSELGDIQWGSGVNGTSLLAALTETETFKECKSAIDVANVLSGKSDDCAEAKLLASIATKHLTTTETAIAADATTVELAAGYWLLVDTSTPADGDARNAALLQVTNKGDITIAKKYNAPEVDKTVSDNDANIGDSVTFTLTATMPSTLEGYETYKVVFHDTMSAGLTYTNNVKVTIGSIDKTSAFDVTPVTDQTTGVTTITISCGDVLAKGATASSQIVVTYTATLNDKAVIGSAGNSNKVKLEYSNDPNWDGDGDEPTGNTPEKEVLVFTYELDVTKVDGQKPSTTLKDAEFVLLNTSKDKVAKVVNNKFVEWVNVPAAGEDGKITWPEGTTLKSGADGKFAVAGLDQGTYYLRETKAPAGYNLLKDDITVVISATITDNALTDLTIAVDKGDATKGDVTNGTVEMQVENNSGSTLPETGGMGTTLFYTLGGILMLAAVVLLVTKKRMNMAE